MSAAHLRRRNGQLPSGRHGLGRAFVEDNQRKRILRAVSAVCARVGYAEMSVGAVIAEAGVSRHTFYQLYPNREAAFLEAFERSTRHVVAVMADAYAAADSFAEGVQDCIETFLLTLAGAPDEARMSTVEALAAGATAIDRRNATMDEVAAILAEGAARFDQSPPGSAVVSQAIVGGIYEIVYVHVLRGDVSTLPDLLPDLVLLALLPYVGRTSAEREYQRLSARRDRLSQARQARHPPTGALARLA